MPEASPLGFPHKRERVTDKNQVPLYEGGTGGGGGRREKRGGGNGGREKGTPSLYHIHSSSEIYPFHASNRATE